MTTLTTGSLSLPDHLMDPWIDKIKFGSTIATLSSPKPSKFGKGHAMSFTIGEAELVEEGANKGGSTVTPKTMSVAPHKFHKTVRWTEEVLWADEDYQMGVVEEILDGIAPALARALDFGVFHGINPATGAAAASIMSKLTNTTNSVEIGASDKPYANLDAADALVLTDRHNPKDVALDPAFAASFAGLRNAQTEQKLYPDLAFATAPASRLDNHNASVSDTVGAVGVASAVTNVKAIVGNFDAVRWGIQRQIALEVIKYGDPDGGGDLKRNNQVAFRAEVVYGWGIGDLDAFAKIVDAA